MDEGENSRRLQDAGGQGDDRASGTLTNQGGINGANSGSIRRYLVLLQDCLAIKFVSIFHLQEKRNQRQQSSCKRSHVRGDDQECQFNQVNQLSIPRTASSQPSCSQLVNDSTSNSGIIGSSGGHASHSTLNNKSVPSTSNKGDYDVIGNGSYCNGRCFYGNNAEWESDQAKQNFTKKQQHYPNCSHPSEKGNLSALKDECVYTARNNICRATKPCPQDITTAHASGSSLSMMTKVDHSMQALFLYKEFRDINLNCFWNSAVHEAFKNLEFKGSIVPSTIIVGSPIRKHLNILKTAWSRKMLRSPSGYLIDFLGEIEEMIADPIAKSHFVPLSDSLCWAIHELTSSGKEAFVDDIFLSLVSAFPGMALPTKELIYQTLEKLTRERKIYQTAQGYFVVTPDTHRYISSTEPLLIQSSINDSQMNAAAANLLRNTILLQETSNMRATSPKQFEIVATEEEKEDVVPPRESLNAPSPDPDTYSLPYGTFRRYNSLRVKKNGGSGTSTGCLPRRTLSMRLPKSKSKNGSKAAISNHSAVVGGEQMGKSRADVTDSFQNLDSSQPSPIVNEQLLTRRRKHKSFLSRLLSFRGVRKSGRKDRAGRSSGSTNKTQLIARNDKSSKVLISSNDDDSDGGGGGKHNDNLSGSIVPGGLKGKTADGKENTTSLATASTQTSFSIENLNTDLTLLSLTPPSKSSTLEREDSDSGRCTDSHSDADAEITAALNRGLSPIIPDRHHHHHRHHHNPDGRRDVAHACNVYEKIESDLGLKVDVDECDGRSPRSPSSQMSVSPSPSTFTTTSATCSRGNSLNRHNIYSRCHSSASSSANSYRDFYNLYRRRYPCYYQQSTPTSLESAELSEGLKFKPHQPMRYPPRSFERRQIFDEISRSSFKEKKHRSNKSVGITSNINSGGSGDCDGDNNGKLSRAGQHDSSECIVTGNDNNNAKYSVLNRAATPSSTILTQTLKNSTNLELEFRLPLGNIFNAAMGGGGAQLTSTMTTSATSSPSSGDKLGSERSALNESSYKADIGRERECVSASPTAATLSEVNTMVNDLFTIKSFVKTNQFNDELSSTIELKTRGSSGNISNNSNNLRNCNSNYSNESSSNHKERQRYVIETVSSKPFTDIHTNFNRESEII